MDSALQPQPGLQARLPECPWLGRADRGRLHGANNGLQTRRPGTKGHLSGSRGLCPWAGTGAAWEEAGGGCGLDNKWQSGAGVVEGVLTSGPVLRDPPSQGRERVGRVGVCRAPAAGRVGGARVGPGGRGRKDSSWGHLQGTWVWCQNVGQPRRSESAWASGPC